tara:strand:- start:660 stop:926 length:267 start_codon:yes stop_codon:yes gene_type:complete
VNFERKRQSLIGKVISAKMEKTVTVKIVREIAHPVYRKRVKRYKKYLVHVASIAPKVGDVVKISQMRPLSKNKRWQVSKILRESVDIG